MRQFLFAGFLTILFSCNNSTTETKPVAKLPSRHSAAFNQSFDSLMNSYYQLTEAFVNWDSVAVAKDAEGLKNRFSKLQMEEAIKDSATAKKMAKDLAELYGNVDNMMGLTSLAIKRERLNDFTQALYSFLQDVKYDYQKVYLRSCGMAFEGKDALWLTNRDENRNPYLGLHHPDYGKSMLDCGDLKDSIDFSSTAVEKK